MFRDEDTELEITYQILTFEPGESSGKRGNQLGVGRGREGGLTRRYLQASAAHFSSLVSQRCKGCRLADSDDKGPAEYKSRAGRIGGQQSEWRELEGKLRPHRPLTSPSHRFFPFRQLVHARAPLLGI